MFYRQIFFANSVFNMMSLWDAIQDKEWLEKNPSSNPQDALEDILTMMDCERILSSGASYPNVGEA